VDTLGRAYVFGITSSSDFPGGGATAGALQPTYPAGAVNQFFFSKLDPSASGTSSLLYSTFIGGSTPSSGTVSGGAIAVDSTFNVYLAGGTSFTAMPIVNASVEGDGIRYHRNVNIGIAVALDWGLIVPVVKQAEERSFLGLQRAINDLGERARGKKLVPDEVQGGTITITNPGIFGPQFGTPIILQPQLAILGMGGIFKEPVVVTDKDSNDSIQIRSIIRLTLGYDHRVIDGADADKFMVAVKNYLENWNEEIG